jgi:hypothetical protein
MAIDSERKRKSVVAISHYALGPVIVPDGTLISTDRQVIGYGYFGIKTKVKMIVRLLGAIFGTIELSGALCGVWEISGEIESTVEFTGEIETTRVANGKIQTTVSKSGEV